MNIEQNIANALLDIRAVGFALEKPITFKSGIISPVYVDNRRFPFYPKQWKTVIDGFKNLVETKNLHFDVIAGIETAGIPHSAALGFSLQKPSVFIRKAAKDHGTKKMVEGGDVKGKKVLLIEDHITTGGSSLHGVHVLQEAGASVTACLAITSYEFTESTKAFHDAHVDLYTLVSFTEIFKEAVNRGIIRVDETQVIQDWISSPHSWGKKHGHE